MSDHYLRGVKGILRRHNIAQLLSEYELRRPLERIWQKD